MYGRDSTDVQLVRADVQIDGPTIFVTFSKAEEGWPFVIENDSDYTFSIAQTVSFYHSSLPLPLKFLTGWQSTTGFIKDQVCLRFDPTFSFGLCVGLARCKG